MNDLIVKNVNVLGDSIMAAKDEEGNIWAGVSYFCKALGMNKGQKDRQVTNVGKDKTLSRGCRKFAAEPYIPTLKEVQEEKVIEMENNQAETIQYGVDVQLSDGSVKHFTLTANDQISLMGLQAQIAQGVDQIPWHTSDQEEHCEYYSNIHTYMKRTSLRILAEDI